MAMKESMGTLKVLLAAVALAFCAVILAPGGIAMASETDGGELLANQPGIVDVTVGDTIEGTIDANHLSNMYALVVPEAGSVHLDVTSWVSYFIYLHTSPYNTGYLQDMIWQGSGQVSSSIPMRKDGYDIVLDAGTYYLQMHNYNTSDNGIYTIETSLDPHPATETEPNDALKDASAFTPGDTISGVISVRGDNDWFSFTLAEPETVSLSVTAEIAWYGLEIYDGQNTDTAVWSSGPIYWNSSAQLSKKDFQVELDPGTYYLRLTNVGMGRTSGPYTVVTSLSIPSVPVYRLFNTETGEHLYTSDANERDVLAGRKPWIYEHVGWNAPKEGDPVYRVFNRVNGDHLYTDAGEANILVSRGEWVWDNGGKPLFYSGGDVEIYRLFNLTNGQHLITRDANEYAVLPSYGWRQEGVKMHAVS